MSNLSGLEFYCLKLIQVLMLSIGIAGLVLISIGEIFNMSTLLLGIPSLGFVIMSIKYLLPLKKS